MESDGNMALGLTAIGLEPIFAGLSEEEIDRFLIWFGDRRVFEEKAAAIKIKRIGRAGDVFLRVGVVLLDILIVLSHPCIETLERAKRRLDLNIHAEMAKAAKAGGDVQGNIVIAAATEEPGPKTVRKLHLNQLFERAFGFVIEPIIVEQDADISASLAFGLRLTQPRSLFESDGFEVLIFFERTDEG